MPRVWEGAFPQRHTPSHPLAAIKPFSKHNTREIPAPRETDSSFRTCHPRRKSLQSIARTGVGTRTLRHSRLRGHRSCTSPLRCPTLPKPLLACKTCCFRQYFLMLTPWNCLTIVKSRSSVLRTDSDNQYCNPNVLCLSCRVLRASCDMYVCSCVRLY